MSGCELMRCPYLTEKKTCDYPEDHCRYNPPGELEGVEIERTITEARQYENPI
jgi:hypothetical protein